MAETSIVRAPLSSGVGASTSIPKTKAKAKKDVLDNLLVDIQDALIVEDLLYVLMVCFRELSSCSRCMAVLWYQLEHPATFFVSDVRSPPIHHLSFISVHIQLTITTMTGALVFLLNLIIVFTNFRASALCFTSFSPEPLQDIEEHIFPIILNARQKMTTH
ncbi:hypothetical protein DFJ58DRAFT_92467 [Suillus subalutaceus]|uniref:uncharacterized protein n=1 Tax=Suillus subalutaceus TaxID=48586 RepID=UPI001B860EC2|nr:uncharacterized protein DFJ58DRAFT_92467 [Suillus subalutaceus]KAG1840363.1 hypothetical protein DFJ58DRAFT_92467 [Suillus subalutaceus]